MSIVIPAYNAERFLPDAIASAQAQTHGRVEIIVVDDGSQDGTAELATRLAATDDRIRVVHQSNRGLSAARNRGIREATGDFISFLDSDDTLHPAKVERQVEALRSTGAGVAYCDYYTADENLVPLLISPTPPRFSEVEHLLAIQNFFPPHAALVRREVVQRVGLFDESLTSSEDWDYWIRCAGTTTLVHVTGALCCYRRHGEQMHNDRARMRGNQKRVLDKHFGRGSDERRLALAAFWWGDAKYQYAHARHARVVVRLLQVLWHARSFNRVRSAVKFGGYG